MERIKCVKCLRWAHLQCVDLHRSVADYIDYFLCSTKCEMGILPFNNLDSIEFDKLVYKGKIDFKKYQKRGKRGRISLSKLNTEVNSSEPVTQCKYLEPDEVHNVVTDKCPNNLTIFHGNVCSLTQNREKLEELFIDSNTLLDIMGITETRLKGDDIKSDFSEYDFVHKGSQLEAGGTGIYIANYLNYSKRKDLNLDAENCEDIWIELHAPKSNIKTKYQGLQNLVIGMIYRHPGSQYKEFSDKLCKNILTINEEKKRFVIMGDININLLKMNVAGTITDYLNDIQSAGCFSFINKATRVVFKGSRWETSCIDHMYSNIDPERMETYVITSDLFDHFSTITKIIDAKNINLSKQKIY